MSDFSKLNGYNVSDKTARLNHSALVESVNNFVDEVNAALEELDAKIGNGNYLPLSGGTLTGTLTTKDVTLKGIEQFQTHYVKKLIGVLSAGTSYANLDSSYKDGTYHRMWRLRFPASCNFWGKIKITLYGTYSSFNASGIMSKTITCNFNGSTIYNNVGCYDGLGVNVEKDFRISEAIWNSTASAWEILVWQKNLSGNNSPTVVIEAWSANQTYLNNVKNIKAQTVELVQDTTYTASKASSTGGTKTVTWATTPVYETPLGEEIATMSDLSAYLLRTGGTVTGNLVGSLGFKAGTASAYTWYKADNTIQKVTASSSGAVSVLTYTLPSQSGELALVSNVQTLLNNRLEKTTYEKSVELACGSNGKVCLGKFGAYDTNITIELNSTTSTTYHATIVIHSQNVAVSSTAGKVGCYVYDDADNHITPLITVFRPYGSESRQIEVYANLPGWSKNLVHVQAVALSTGGMTDVLTSVDAIPTEIEGKTPVTPVNVLTNSFLGKTAKAASATVADSANSVAWSNVTGKPTIPSISVTQSLTSGTEIGSIKVGSTTTKLYAPTATGGLGSQEVQDLIKNSLEGYAYIQALEEGRYDLSEYGFASNVNNPNLSYYATDDGTTTAGTWLAKCDNVTSLFDGLSVKYKITKAGASTTTFNLNGLGAKTVYLRGTTKLTTHYAVNTMIHLIYSSSTGAWYVADYDTTSGQFRQYYTLTTANGEYPIVYSYTTATGTSSYKTTYGAVKGGFTFNPSTNTLTVANLNGKASSSTVADSANSVAWDNVSGKPTFAKVATSGSYNDLTNKPSAYSLPLAANGTRGGIQIGYTASGANIPLQLSGEKAYVALTKTAVTTALGYTPPDTDTTYSVATASAAGLVKPVSVITKPTLNSVTATSGKYYQVQMSSDGNMFVNVPWSGGTTTMTSVAANTDVRYTDGLYMCIPESTDTSITVKPTGGAPVTVKPTTFFIYNRLGSNNPFYLDYTTTSGTKQRANFTVYNGTTPGGIMAIRCSVAMRYVRVAGV